MRIEGVSQVMAELRKKSGNIERDINARTEATARFIDDEARKRAPEAFGKLRQSITVTEIDKATYKVSVNKNYGVYMEFGTGDRFAAPAEFKDMAAEFKGVRTGTKKQAIDSLKDWCKKKGIDEKEAPSIFYFIMKNGLNPQPFFYPAWQLGKKKYLKELKELLKKK